MLMINAVPKSAAELLKAAYPERTNEPEAIPYIFYDTQTILAANTATVFSFFTTVQSDDTLGNIEQANTLPDPQFFEIVGFHFDVLTLPSANAAAAGTIDDIAEMLNTRRGTFVFTMNQKGYTKIPLAALHSLGGISALASGTQAAGTSLSYAQNYAPDGGFYVGKRIVIPPKQTFSAQIKFGTAPTPSVDTQVRLSISGVLHRRVL